jgi:hypothetical protein
VKDPLADKKRAPNRLIVDEAQNDDNSVVSLSESKVSFFHLALLSWFSPFFYLFHFILTPISFYFSIDGRTATFPW